MRVLIVEDDRDLCTTLQYILGREGYRTLVAPTGNEARERLQQTPVPGLGPPLQQPLARRAQGLEPVLQGKRPQAARLVGQTEGAGRGHRGEVGVIDQGAPDDALGVQDLRQAVGDSGHQDGAAQDDQQ